MIATSPVVRTISAGDFVASLLSKPSPDSLPLACTLDITERCNLECVHCFLGGRRNGGNGDLPVERACRLFEMLSTAGVLVLVVTGGEPLMHPGFRTIWREARRKGFLVSLFTNGTLVDGELAAFLADHPPRRVEVSAYGYTEATYESITGTTGSYARFLDGVECLRATGAKVRLKFPVLRENQHELDAAREWAERMGMGFRCDALVSPTLDGETTSLARRLVPEDAARHLPEAFHAGLSECEAADSRPSGNAALIACGAGVKTIHVDVSGDMHPCVLWRNAGRSLLETTPREWARHMAILREERLPRSSRCSGCRVRTHCPSCPALSRLETGRAGAAVAHFCELMRVLGRSEAT